MPVLTGQYPDGALSDPPAASPKNKSTPVPAERRNRGAC